VICVVGHHVLVDLEELLRLHAIEDEIRDRGDLVTL
jgi:hypothetical protein